MGNVMKDIIDDIKRLSDELHAFNGLTQRERLFNRIHALEQAISAQNHEINNIASIILGNAEMGMISSADTENHLKEIIKAVERLIKIEGNNK